ncbi:hypothetical protein [Legionella donaldsonii]|uniref:hypothetical protein n=1 Tax=Legionella donaldsonii TaxID=45060 RepID=UPI00399C7142
MMIILELVQQFCGEELKYDLTIDKQPGRASWQNPTLEFLATTTLLRLCRPLLATGPFLLLINITVCIDN